MHELSIAVAIVDGVLEEAERHGGAEVDVIHVRVGRLSGVDRNALMFAFHVAREGTPLALSTLEIEEVSATVFCSVCERESEADSAAGQFCPQCGEPAAIVAGDDLEITALEMAA